jgi:hypothetical protein
MNHFGVLRHLVTTQDTHFGVLRHLVTTPYCEPFHPREFVRDDEKDHNTSGNRGQLHCDSALNQADSTFYQTTSRMNHTWTMDASRMN